MMNARAMYCRTATATLPDVVALPLDRSSAALWGVTHVLRLRPDALEWRLVDGEVVALDLERSEYLLVNRTGAVLWQLLAAGASPADLVDRLVETYRLDEALVRADIDAFLAGLASRQLLES
jgi:hypothetical protein